jgi:glycerol-3-phosphate cytidylyltransferase
MFEEIREQCDWLIVGVQTDPSVDRPAKNRPIQKMNERVGQVRALRCVDEVIVYETEADLLHYLSTEPPDVRFLGADWEGKQFTGHDLPIRNIFNSRDHGYSTSELRRRIADAHV